MPPKTITISLQCAEECIKALKYAESMTGDDGAARTYMELQAAIEKSKTTSL